MAKRIRYLPQVSYDASYPPIVQSLLSVGAENSDILKNANAIHNY